MILKKVLDHSSFQHCEQVTHKNTQRQQLKTSSESDCAHLHTQINTSQRGYPHVSLMQNGRQMAHSQTTTAHINRHKHIIKMVEYLFLHLDVLEKMISTE